MKANPTSDEVLDLLSQITNEVDDLPQIPQPEPIQAAPSPENPAPTGSEPSPEPLQNQPENPEPIAPPVDCGAIAESIIGFTSNVFDLGGKRLYPARILEPGDIEKLNTLNRTVKLNKPVSVDETLREETEKDPELVDILIRWEKCDAAIKGAPFTETEKKLLRDPLEKVIQKYKLLQVGPELVLFFAVVMVMTPRITPIMPGFTSFISETLSRSKS